MMPNFISDMIDTFFAFLESKNITTDKLIKYLALFFILLAIYSTYLQKFILTILTRPRFEMHASYLLTILFFLFFTGWPFALLAYIDNTWRSKEAAHVAFWAYFLSVVIMFHKFGIKCGLAAVILFFPFIASATLSHGIISWLKPREAEEEEE